MTTNKITEADLHAYIDNALDDARRSEVARYLVDHPGQAQRVEVYRRQRENLRAAFASVAEEPIPPRLLLSEMVAAPRRAASPRWHAVAASFALICLGALSGWGATRLLSPPERGIGALAGEAAASYAVFAPDRVRPVEVREEQEMLNWASKRLKRSVSAPDLLSVGFRFMGGRLVATTHGPAVLFMYDDDRGDRLVFLSRDMTVDKEAPLAQHSQGEITAFAWATKGIGYSIVGHMPAGQLQRAADQACRQMGERA